MFYKYLSFVKGEYNKYKTLIWLSLNKGKIWYFPFQFQGGSCKNETILNSRFNCGAIDHGSGCLRKSDRHI